MCDLRSNLGRPLFLVLIFFSLSKDVLWFRNFGYELLMVGGEGNFVDTCAETIPLMSMESERRVYVH